MPPWDRRWCHWFERSIENPTEENGSSCNASFTVTSWKSSIGNPWSDGKRGRNRHSRSLFICQVDWVVLYIAHSAFAREPDMDRLRSSQISPFKRKSELGRFSKTYRSLTYRTILMHCQNDGEWLSKVAIGCSSDKRSLFDVQERHYVTFSRGFRCIDIDSFDSIEFSFHLSVLRFTARLSMWYPKAIKTNKRQMYCMYMSHCGASSWHAKHTV